MITLETVETDFGTINVLKRRASGAITYEQGGFQQSEADNNGVSLASYIHAIFALILQSKAHKILLVGCGGGTLATMLATLTSSPAKLLGLPGGTLAKGAPADLVLVDDGEPFVVASEELHSRARNTAFEGRKFQGRARMTFVGGECVFKRS